MQYMLGVNKFFLIVGKNWAKFLLKRHFGTVDISMLKWSFNE